MRVRAECSVGFCSEPFRNALIKLEEQVRESSNLSPDLEKKYARLQISTPGSVRLSVGLLTLNKIGGTLITYYVVKGTLNNPLTTSETWFLTFFDGAECITSLNKLRI